jgi:hypothetical protein
MVSPPGMCLLFHDVDFNEFYFLIDGVCYICATSGLNVLKIYFIELISEFGNYAEEHISDFEVMTEIIDTFCEQPQTKHA